MSDGMRDSANGLAAYLYGTHGRLKSEQEQEKTEEEKKIYRFFWDCGRMGVVRGVFMATESEVSEAIGKTVHFGEILGKHSDVHGNLQEGDLTVVSDDQDFIEKAVEYGLIPVGYNPLEHIYEY